MKKNEWAIKVALSVKETLSQLFNSNSLESIREDYCKNTNMFVDLAIEKPAQLCRHSMLDI